MSVRVLQQRVTLLHKLPEEHLWRRGRHGRRAQERAGGTARGGLGWGLGRASSDSSRGGI